MGPLSRSWPSRSPTAPGAGPHALPPGRRRDRQEPVRRGAGPARLGLSPLCYHFLGGVLAHARALCAVTSPTVNCYKRLQIGSGLTGTRSGFTWTPAFVTYGDNNRTQMIRTPEAGHVEDRTVSSAFNPYLAFAAYAGAGLDGIRRKLDPGDPNRDNAYALGLDEMTRRGVRLLPQSLPEALDELERDEVVKAAWDRSPLSLSASNERNGTSIIGKSPRGSWTAF